eukprot:COSAG02_NODE_1063_length_14846_cov_134.162745_1_plen_141_part_10
MRFLHTRRVSLSHQPPASAAPVRLVSPAGCIRIAQGYLAEDSHLSARITRVAHRIFVSVCNCPRPPAHIRRARRCAKNRGEKQEKCEACPATKTCPYANITACEKDCPQLSLRRLPQPPPPPIPDQVWFGVWGSDAASNNF